MKEFLSCIIGGCHGFIALHAYRIGDTHILAAAVVSFIVFIIYREVTE
jgi:hypothetical protein